MQLLRGAALHVAGDYASGVPARKGAAKATPIAEVEAVLLASRALVAVSARSLSPVEEVVTAMQWRLLVVVASRGTAASHEVAAALGVHASTATRLCDRLVAEKLLSREDDPDDRRYLVLALTPKGRRLVEDVLAARRADIERILDRLSESGRSQLVAGLLEFAEAAEAVEVDPLWDLIPNISTT